MKYIHIKKNSKKLFALLCAGCLLISGCGTPSKGTAPQTQTPNKDESSQTDQNVSASGGDVSTTDTTASQSDIPSPSGVADIASSIKETIPEKEEISGEEHSLVGIITDATTYSVTIQTPEGDFHSLTIPETGVKGNLNYIVVGQMATLTYVGSLDENHAALVGISDSSMITGIYVEEYAFALKIIQAVKDMDMKAISDLTNFPVFIDTGNYKGPMNTSGEFEAIDNEKIFTEALVNRMANYNLFDLQYTDAGFVMGNGAPSITFDVDDDGILGIIGITSAAPANNN